MFLDQIVGKQQKQVKQINNTPKESIRQELKTLGKRVDEQGKLIGYLEDVQTTNKLEDLQTAVDKLQKSFDFLVSRLSEADETVGEVSDIDQHYIDDTIWEALRKDIPVMPLKNSPETGIKSLGLPIPVAVRARLLDQKKKYSIISYKGAVFTALYIGLQMLEDNEPPGG